MRKNNLLHVTKSLITVCFFAMACNTPVNDNAAKALAINNQEDANIKKYSHIWDEIINNRKLDMFNDSNFSKNIVMHVSPADLVGLDSARAYYANYLTGFSDISFSIKNVFAQGENLVKQWNFKGKHTGIFFGIPATGKTVNLDGVTIVRMEDGKIAEERDFFDNLEFSQQLGLIPR